MNVYFYSVLLVLQLPLFTSSVFSRKLHKKGKASDNKVFEKMHSITVKIPILEASSHKRHVVAPRTIATTVEPVEESCQSDNFKNQFSTLKQKVRCEPRDTVVELVSPLGAILTPNAVIVKRCGGMCNGFKSCLSVQQKEQQFYVKIIKNNKIHCSSVTVVEDIKCRCNCIQTPSNCNKLQTYNKDKCSCVCKNQREHNQCVENQDMIWNDSLCSCVCQQRKSCTTGTYWEERECR
ncbi:hypothetical protein FQA39_LY08516 [Lamprigera yunnana]|nr:hypothetical protein FQA39_LY08516 [Lamprigera yunnana]